jgi:CDP-paratose synthetase
MNILLTGGSGFLGSALARRWVGDGHALTLLLRPASSLRRIEALQGRVAIERFDNDDSLRASVARAQPDLVVHTACSYGRRGESALQTFDANTRFGMVLLDALLAGPARGVHVVNTGSVLAPEVSAYAMSKHQFSQWGRALARDNPAQLRFVDVRLQHMYGPDDDASKFTTHVLHACRRGEARLALTAGQQRRDFIYIDDVVDAYECIRANPGALDTLHSIDVGSGEAPTVREFVETVRELTGSGTVLDFGAVPYRANEAMHCCADVTTLQALGWTRRHSLRQGIQKTIDREFHS